METPEEKDDRCGWCGELIQIQVFKGTGYCSENHRKLRVIWGTGMIFTKPTLDKETNA